MREPAFRFVPFALFVLGSACYIHVDGTGPGAETRAADDSASRALTPVQGNRSPKAHQEASPDDASIAVDAGSETTPMLDAPRSEGSDAGLMGAGEPSRSAPTLDGVRGPSEWDHAASALQELDSNWDAHKNTLLALRAQVIDGSLWLLVEGAVEAPNTIVVYVDAQTDAGTVPAQLTDNVGALDDAIASVVTISASHAPELAWATTSTRVDAAFADRAGWRDLRTAKDLKWLMSPEAATACNAGTCEARVALEALGPVERVSIFARLTNGTGALLSNQTLPVDNPLLPAVVGKVLALPDEE